MQMGVQEKNYLQMVNLISIELAAKQKDIPNDQALTTKKPLHRHLGQKPVKYCSLLHTNSIGTEDKAISQLHS